jgi:two-component system sensor histidine kinase UhpB
MLNVLSRLSESNSIGELWSKYIIPKHYSKQQALNLVKEIALQLLFVIVYAVIYYSLYHLSKNWYTHKYWSTWFLPAGWQLGCMLLLPYRYWFSLFMSHIIVNGVITINYGNQPNFELLHILQKTIWKLAIVLIVWVVKALFKGRFLTHFKGVLIFLVCASLVQLVVGIELTYNSRFYTSIPEERKFEVLLSFFVGGLIGNLFIASTMLACKQFWVEKENVNWHKVGGCCVALIALASIALYLYFIQPHTLYLLRVLAFIPIIWFSARYGWAGGWASSMLTMLLIAASVYDLSDSGLIIESQFYVVAIGVSGLLFGALVNEQKQLQVSLHHRNHDLELSINKNQRLSNKLVTIQENERRKFSNELHDEVGQNITALKTELKLLELSLAKTETSGAFVTLKEGTDQIYDSVYRVMNWLRPRILDELGLKEVLLSQYFSTRLMSAGIEYHIAIKGDTDTLDDNQKTAIFRIVQESINNCIRHSKACNFFLLLEVINDGVSLKLSDDGKGIDNFSSNVKGGFGLSGIEERILLLNGEYNLNTSETGFSLELSFPLNNVVIG